MCAENKKKPGLWSSIFSNRCPRCREGKLFLDPNAYHLKSTMQMPEYCPVCGQPYELQTGFYFGTGYVAYAVTVALIAVSFVIWYFTLGFSLHDNRIYYWLGTTAAVLFLIQPIIQRFCRSMWIAIFVRYNPDWRSHIITHKPH